MAYETIAVEKRGHIAEVRLNRPDRGNPIDARFLDELDAAAASIHDDPEVYVVLLTAAGDVFSSGRLAEPEMMARHDRLPFRALELMGQPVVAAIEGDAIGAGLELALACDMRVASEEAMFAIPDVEMGMAPSGGATARLPRIAGRGLAAELILLGARIDGRRAAASGLVNEALPRPAVRARAEAVAQSMAAQGPLALRYAKEAMLRGLDMPLDQALRFETDLTVILQTTADRAEGVRAFLEKRSPRFEGK
ncbi:MAG TPA: enoyl-CoA hydratase/isomerase family protein [Dehalococcoidia bacterium]|nr:enoyl-CoA hydratase/isomerase family protein [Dehalococcoidia bacterium]